jgi:hypothetical protein
MFSNSTGNLFNFFWKIISVTLILGPAQSSSIAGESILLTVNVDGQLFQHAGIVNVDIPKD